MVKELGYHIKELGSDLINLIWPTLCCACNQPLFKTEEQVCTNCLANLPRTHFHLWAENDFHKLFWGRIPVMYATAFFYYQKENRFQKLIHKLKYQNLPEIGVVLGKEFGYEIKKSVFSEIDVIMPVPLHPKKQHLRGYNQSETIALGMSSSMEKPYDTETLIRNVHTATQTRKGRFERWENVHDIFTVTNPQKVKGKHILVVDDVVTTGATLEACVSVLQANGAKAVSLATLGIA